MCFRDQFVSFKLSQNMEKKFIFEQVLIKFPKKKKNNGVTYQSIGASINFLVGFGTINEVIF